MHNLFVRNEPAGIIHPPFIPADLKNMALILQHYWQPLNTCPKAVNARGTQTAVKYVSLGKIGGLKCKTPLQLINGLRRPSYPPGGKGPHDWAKAWPLTTTHLNHERSKRASVYSMWPLFGGSPALSPKLYPVTPSSRMLSTQEHTVMSKQDMSWRPRYCRCIGRRQLPGKRQACISASSFSAERRLGGGNCQAWPSATPVSTCPVSTCKLLTRLTPSSLQTAIDFLGHYGIRCQCRQRLHMNKQRRLSG